MMGDGTRWLVTGERCGWSSGLWGSIVVVLNSEAETEKSVMHWKESRRQWLTKHSMMIEYWLHCVRRVGRDCRGENKD